MFYRYEHYMSISHITLIVNMVQDFQESIWRRGSVSAGTRQAGAVDAFRHVHEVG